MQGWVVRRRLRQLNRGRRTKMNTWKGAFVAVLMSGVVLGIFNGHLAVWTAVGAALGAVLAGRERSRVVG
jgi:hypothetical protein